MYKSEYEKNFFNKSELLSSVMAQKHKSSLNQKPIKLSIDRSIAEITP